MILCTYELNYGLQEATSENTAQMFLHLAKTMLNLNIEDSTMDTSHRVVNFSTRNKRPHTSSASCEHKQQFIKNRCKLKRMGVVVKEVLANAKSCLLDQTRKHKKTKNCSILDEPVSIEGINKTEVKIKINYYGFSKIMKRIDLMTFCIHVK